MANYTQREMVLVEPPSSTTPPAPMPGFAEPQRPDPALIQIIHRGHDGYIAIARKLGVGTDKQHYENICSIPANALPGIFDQMTEMLDADSYFGINGMYRGGYGANRFGLSDAAGNALPNARRTNKDVRWLTSCFTDIDCVKFGITVGAAFGAVIDAQDKGILPPASIITRSGNGLWLFWLVSGADHKEPSECSPAYRERIDLWAEVQGAICNRLVNVGSDANALDAARITRIPGSVNTKAQARVAYWVQYDTAGTVPKYKLAELAAAFGAVKKQVPASLRLVQNIYQARGHKGQAGRWASALRQFERLWKMRGKFKVGTRNAAVWVYAVILRRLPGKLKLEEKTILEALEALRRDLEQPPADKFTHADLVATFESTKAARLARIRNQTIADKLNITQDEAAMLEGWPPAMQYGPAPPAKLTRPEVAKRRRQVIADLVAKWGGVIPPTRELAAHVAGMGLEEPSPATVGTDLEALGLANPRNRKPKPPAPEPPRLF